MRARPTCTEEFKNGAVNLLKESDRTFKDVADSLGVSIWSLREWYSRGEMAKKPKKGRPRKLPQLPTEETAEQKLTRLERENATLRKENDSLRMDREILKKAAAKSIGQGNMLRKLSAGERNFSVFRGRALSSFAI